MSTETEKINFDKSIYCDGKYTCFKDSKWVIYWYITLFTLRWKKTNHRRLLKLCMCMYVCVSVLEVLERYTTNLSVASVSLNYLKFWTILSDKDKMFLFETLSPYFFLLKSQTPGTILSRFWQCQQGLLCEKGRGCFYANVA